MRFAGVGDGGGAYFKVALGRGQLLGDGGLARARRAQSVLRCQHVEIGLRHPHDQVLFGGLQISLRKAQAALGLVDGQPVAPVVKRVPGAQSGLHRGGTDPVARHLHLLAIDRGVAVGRHQLLAVGADAQAHAGTPQGIHLRGLVLRRIGQRTRRQISGVIGARSVVQILQALRLGTASSTQREGNAQRQQLDGVARIQCTVVKHGLPCQREVLAVRGYSGTSPAAAAGLR